MANNSIKRGSIKFLGVIIVTYKQLKKTANLGLLYRAKHLFDIDFLKALFFIYSQPAITCSKLTIETLEQGVKYVQS